MGKKKYRLETARRLVFASMMSSHENSKVILFPPEQARGNALFQVLDPSLPFWAERDKWARWTSISAHEEESIGVDTSTQLAFSDHMQRLLIAPHQREQGVKQLIGLEKLIHSLFFPEGSENNRTRRSVVAM